ncbi:hypothetical protein J2S55_004009 [Streptosporangium brasiliense]|uniref:Uncharacterized protein n=1 Tax=Streptosporangium brasiliense TaxID=47480 RepID=A0ABT9R6H4_9ACTN|nr:hypothetical protein [Streptosporangium brasiliense]
MRTVSIRPAVPTRPVVLQVVPRPVLHVLPAFTACQSWCF